MLASILSLGGIGLLASVTLGIAAKKFAVEVDPREAAILDVLSAANCGACGYPGCGAYAKAVVEQGASASLCTPGGMTTIEAIAAIMGVTAVTSEPQVAVVLCQGDSRKASFKYRYVGIQDCLSAQKLADGPKTCPGGCIGLGTCARICPFGAIDMTAEGLAVINREKCTGCRKCVAYCPRQVIAIVPRAASVHVLCNSHDKGAVVRKYCQVGCITCQICKKTVPEAYRIDNFLARVIYDHDQDADAAIEKCPTKCIHDFAPGQGRASRMAEPSIPIKPQAAA